MLVATMLVAMMPMVLVLLALMLLVSQVLAQAAHAFFGATSNQPYISMCSAEQNWAQ